MRAHPQACDRGDVHFGQPGVPDYAVDAWLSWIAFDHADGRVTTLVYLLTGNPSAQPLLTLYDDRPTPPLCNARYQANPFQCSDVPRLSGLQCFAKIKVTRLEARSFGIRQIIRQHG